MRSYHIAWLEAHPQRNAEWLLERLADGFDIHHMDGDHSNNDPANLVLLEHADHFRIHGTRALRRIAPRAKDTTRGRSAYALRLEGKRWREVNEAFGAGSIIAAKQHALEHGLLWPIAVSLPHWKSNDGQRRKL